ncbi:hypothetical protein SCALIN_C28_0360 [Candidatus Scalindua japonica]|uniref:Uncharacterized protein n=2 Tax=Candidatus Scalindua japonica TaxID=1284222 RepID=A0A286U205_9BACT|nr:hypothetical protein SCALIN_C28_0360 [Candidatus Scalindua japonica]
MGLPLQGGNYFEKQMKPFQMKCLELVPWATMALTVLGSHFAADAVMETVAEWSHGSETAVFITKICYLVFFIGMVYLLIRQKDNIFHPRTRYISNEEAEEREHLVLFLSNLPKDLEESDGVPDNLQLSQNIDKDLEKIEKLKKGALPLRWAWEMPLRAIQHHQKKLKTLTLVCSKESISQVNLFAKIFERYRFNNLDKIYLLAQKQGKPLLVDMFSEKDIADLNGFNFQSFDELSQAMWFLMRKFRKYKYSESQIMIDITSGQKPTSIVGASMTFNRVIKAQYVSTNQPWDVLSYDVLLTSSEPREFGL